MKRAAFSLAAAVLSSLSFTVTAKTLYVDVKNAGAVVPYTNWITAATNIQDAVDAAVAGDRILVTNGLDEAGARAVYGMSNRVAVAKPVTVQSVNGPGVTIIGGYGPGGPAAVRCAYLTNGAVLAGFTLTNGATQSSGDSYKQASGGGVWCESGAAVVSNCVVAGNSGAFTGGGAYQGTLNHCTLSGNSAFVGGGVSGSTLDNCLLNGNSAGYGGGASGSTLDHCTLRGN